MTDAGRDESLVHIDGLRGLAALAVALFYHYVHFLDPFQPSALTIADAPGAGLPVIGWLYVQGWRAVDLFFVLSGLVFHKVYAAEIAERRIGFADFAARRVARIYPAHLAGLAAVAAIMALTGPLGVTAPGSLPAFLGNLLLVNDGSTYNQPAWSLTVEMLLYGLFFLAMRFGGPTIWCAPAILAGVWIFLSTDLFWATGIARGLMGFFLAVGIAEAVRAYRSGEPVSPLLLVGLAVTLPFAWWIRTWAFDLVALAAVGLCGAVPPIRRLLASAPLRHLGSISLAIYMIHLPLQMVLIAVIDAVSRQPPADRLWFWLLYAALVLVAAELLHRSVERPARTILRRLWDGRGPGHVRPGNAAAPAE